MLKNNTFIDTSTSISKITFKGQVTNRRGTQWIWSLMAKKTIEVDSKMIDLAVDELSKLMIHLDKNPKKTRKDQNTIKKIQEIRDTIQDSVLYAKLKKSTE